MIIATQELVNMKKQINYNIVADINNLERLKNDLSQIKKNTPIKIYDLGTLSKQSQEILEVKDHINKTGINPIIGYSKIEFKDISKAYKAKTGIITTCCGKRLNLNYQNPSYFLCVFSVLVFYLGFKDISGFIVNN